MGKTVGSFGRLWEADLAVALLPENGLHPDDLLTSLRAGLGGAEAFFYVVVPETETAAAIQLLKGNGYERNIVRQAG